MEAYQFASMQTRAEAGEVWTVRLACVGVEYEAGSRTFSAERLQHSERMLALVELARRVTVRLRGEGFQL